MSDFVIEDGIMFKYNGKGGEVVIPGGVTEIDSYAFSKCGSITKITIPDSVKIIGDSAFNECKNLTEAVIHGDSAKICAWAFDGCSSLISVRISDGVTEIKHGAFNGCVSLEDVIIPESVTKIGMGAFKDTKYIAKLAEAGGGFAVVNNILLAYSGSAETAVIPANVTKIVGEAFSGCKKLTGIVIPEGVTEIGAFAFGGCSGLKSVTVPDSVKKIGVGAFNKCRSLEYVSIPEGITGMNSEDFSGCINIKVLRTDSESALGCFKPADKLKFTAAFLSDMESYSDKCKDIYISFIKKQKKKIIEAVIEQKNAAALSGIFSLDLIDIKNIDSFIEKANSEKNTEMLAMLMNWKNNSFTPSEVEKEEARKIKSELKRDPSSLSEMKKIWAFEELPDGTLSLISYKGKDTEITVPDMIGKKKVTVLGEEVFSPFQSRVRNKNVEVRKEITSVTLPDGITKIDKKAFYFCYELVEVNIPESVTKIKSSAFSGCEKLKEITVPGSVTEIGIFAFSCSENLTLRAPAGSYAEKYAKENEINFEAIN